MSQNALPGINVTLLQQCGTSGFVVADPSSQYVPQAFLQGGTQQDASLAKRERKSSSATAMTISQASLIPITYQTGLASANETLTSGMWQNLAPTNCETMTLQEFTQLINSPAATCGTAIAGGGLFLVGVFGEPLTLGGSTVLVVGGAGLAAFNGVQCATLVANGSLGAQIQTIFKENGYGSSDTFNVCTGPTAFASSSIIVSPINLPATPPPATASCSITVTNVPSQGASINISGHLVTAYIVGYSVKPDWRCLEAGSRPLQRARDRAGAKPCQRADPTELREQQFEFDPAPAGNIHENHREHDCGARGPHLYAASNLPGSGGRRHRDLRRLACDCGAVQSGDRLIFSGRQYDRRTPERNCYANS